MSKINFTNSNNSIQFSIDENTLYDYYQANQEVQLLNGDKPIDLNMSFSIHLDFETNSIDINPFPIG